eukprot:CAMPEP_0204588846 /NCGR_PEP_ID=MMETSP0661-20131031/48854_1 /ASSEMBLY_ACC=CAM_ASM_000606 /TAXON_ID=109239 /ORGANISM="Alexandrium margalefi, Strain AMGDE01CS-322" /LENGTH=104 /DNA_ID=CAMNT_0051598695 /DNA_START=70 /DNA_END=381 /DNA_ORIENTATION=-
MLTKCSLMAAVVAVAWGGRSGPGAFDVRLKGLSSGSSEGAPSLGLQGSVQLSRGPREEAPPPLSFADVSVLGLQRSAQIVRRRRPDPAQQPEAAAPSQPERGAP